MVGLHAQNIYEDRLGGFQDFSLFDARRANTHPFCLAIHLSTYALEIWQPATSRLVMRVAYIVSANRFFSTNTTHFCHNILKLKESSMVGGINIHKTSI